MLPTESYTETAHAYLTNWSPWLWVLMTALLLLAVLITFAQTAIIIFIKDLGGLGVIIGACVLALAVLLVLVNVPASLMRHLPHQGIVWLIIIPGLIVAGIWTYLGLASDHPTGARWFYWAPAVALALGVIFGGINDWLFRTASGVPTSVLGLFELALAIGLGVVAIASKR